MIVVNNVGLFTIDYLQENQDSKLFELKLKSTTIEIFSVQLVLSHHLVRLEALRMVTRIQS